MPPENNQNLNNQTPPQVENKSSGLNTIMLILLIALVGFGIWFLVSKKEVNNEIGTDSSSLEVPAGPFISEEDYVPPPPLNPQNQEDQGNTSENLETGIFIKNIYTKEGKWLADVDFITRMSAVELVEFQINKGECSIPGMTKDEIIDYARTITGQNSENNLLGQHCSDIFRDFTVFEFGEIVNQNPLLRTFEFSNNFNTMNDCPEGKNTTILEWKERSVKEVYAYSLYGTRGVYIRRAEIKNNQITTFDMVNGCAG